MSIRDESELRLAVEAVRRSIETGNIQQFRKIFPDFFELADRCLECGLAEDMIQPIFHALARKIWEFVPPDIMFISVDLGETAVIASRIGKPLKRTSTNTWTLEQLKLHIEGLEQQIQEIDDTRDETR
jgi:hypothetical protein